MSDGTLDPDAKTFRIDNGICTITPTEILVTQLDKSGNPVAPPKSSIVKMTLFYGGLGMLGLLYGVLFIRQGNLVAGITFILLALLILLFAYHIRTHSLSFAVNRSAILEFIAYAPMEGAPYGSFSVLYNDGSNLKKRRFFLPTHKQGAEQDFWAAARILTADNVITKFDPLAFIKKGSPENVKPLPPRGSASIAPISRCTIPEYHQLRDLMVHQGARLLSEEDGPFGSAFSLLENPSNFRFRCIWDGKEEWLRIDAENSVGGWDWIEPIAHLRYRTWVDPVDRTHSTDVPPEFDQLCRMIPALLSRAPVHTIT